MYNPAQTIASKCANSPAINQLVQNMNDYFSPWANLDQFYDNVWNIETAVGYGLLMWGRRVGVGNVVQVPAFETFGFANDGVNDYTGFGQAPFAGGVGSTQNVTLTDDAYRQVILTKAAANVCNGSIPAINQLLLNLFPGQGNVYVTETGPLQMTYTFTFALTPAQYATITQLDILPRPCGVSATFVVPA